MSSPHQPTQGRNLLQALTRSKQPLLTAALFQARPDVNPARISTLELFITSLAKVGRELDITRREQQHVADAFESVRSSPSYACTRLMHLQYDSWREVFEMIDGKQRNHLSYLGPMRQVCFGCSSKSTVLTSHTGTMANAS